MTGGEPSTSADAAATAQPAAVRPAAPPLSSRQGWRWCEDCCRWVPGGSTGWPVHLARDLHKESLSDNKAHRARRPDPHPRPVWRPDYSVVAVVSQGSRQGALTPDLVVDVEHEVTLTPAQALLLQRALQLEVPHHCTPAMNAAIRHYLGAEQLVHLQDSCGIRGHYKSRGELVLPAHRTLALLPVAVAALPPVWCLRITVRKFQDWDGWEPIACAAIVLLGSALPFLHQRRVTIWWHADDLVEQVTSRFLQFAAAALASSYKYFLRQIIIKIGSDDVPAPLREAQDLFAAALAAAARRRRQMVLMGTHPRAAAAGCLLRQLPPAVLGMILADGLPLAPCTCLTLGPKAERPRR